MVTINSCLIKQSEVRMFKEWQKQMYSCCILTCASVFILTGILDCAAAVAIEIAFT